MRLRPTSRELSGDDSVVDFEIRNRLRLLKTSGENRARQPALLRVFPPPIVHDDDPHRTRREWFA